MNIKSYLMLGIVGLTLIGCASGPYHHGFYGPPSVVVGRGLDGRLDVDEDIDTRRDSRDRLHVAANMKNVSDETLHLQAQTIWRDEYGDRLYRTGWENLTLKPGQEATYEKMARTPETDDFTVRIRQK